MTTGPGCSAATRRASATASSDRPRPGPSATASARASSSSASGSARTMISGTRPSSAGTASFGRGDPGDAGRGAKRGERRHERRPDVAGRAADDEHRAGRVLRAPDGLRPGGGQRLDAGQERCGRLPVGLRRDADVGDDDAAGGAAPGLDRRPQLAAVEADRDVGRDRRSGDDAGRGVDTRGHVERDDGADRRPHRLDRPAATAPRGAPRNPVPRSASTTTSARVSRARRTPSTTSMPSFRAMSWFRRASGGSLRASPASRHSTSQPAVCRCRATTNPSPPLLPAPQTTAARPPAPSRMISSAAARPARSISTAPGMPKPSIAAASTARISSAV